MKICQNDWARLHQGLVIWRQSNHPSSPVAHQLLMPYGAKKSECTCPHRAFYIVLFVIAQTGGNLNVHQQVTCAFWGISFRKHLVLPFVTWPLAVQQSSRKKSRTTELEHTVREGTDDEHQGLVQRHRLALPGSGAALGGNIALLCEDRENQALESTWQSLASPSDRELAT